MTPKIVKDDVIHFAKNDTGEKFHALLCDPPYHLTSIVKRFGKKGSAPAKFGSDGAFARASKGFMGQEWDGGDIAFRPETWLDFGELLYPGAFGIAFASCRGYHRMAVAIEDAGFIIHPMIGWLYGQGFPKAHQVKGDKQFKEHRYGLQALKPALEPLVVFQKPYEGKPLDCIKQTGAGTLNIGGCRIAGEDVPVNVLEKWSGLGQEKQPKYKATKNTLGRWPANIMHDGSDEVLNGFPQSAGQLAASRADGSPKHNMIYGKMNHVTQSMLPRNDSGSAARFFYAAKASKREKDEGCYEIEETRSKCRPNEPETGYKDDALCARLHKSTKAHNSHPTVKPLALCKWLATLLLPPDAYAPRRLFVPFAGSGSEMIGADIAGWEEIIGVEFMAEYTQLAKSRIAYWHTHKGDIK